MRQKISEGCFFNFSFRFVWYMTTVVPERLQAGSDGYHLPSSREQRNLQRRYMGKEIHTKKILILGIGNTLRGDDGAGIYVAGEIEKMNIPGVSVRILQQLHTELVEVMTAYDTIIIADASVNEQPLEFYELGEPGTQAAASSHHTSAALLAGLADRLYQKHPQILICSIKGENFDMEEGLSSLTLARADKAVLLIKKWISNLKSAQPF